MSNNGLEASTSPRGTRGPGVRRINHVPIWIASGVALVFIACVCIVGALRGSQQAAPAPVDHGGSAVQMASAMVGARDGGIVPKASPSSSPGASPAVVTAAVQPPPPAASATPTPDEVQKQRQAAYRAALLAKPGVEDQAFEKLSQQKQQFDAQQVAALQKADPNNSAELLAEYRRQLDEAHNAQGPNNGPNELANFQGAGSGDRWTNAHRVTAPISPYILQTGSVIPALTITAMDSDLPGAIVAQVSQDVYDSPTGQYLLIPQGTKIFGEYVSGSGNGVGYGQSRIFVAWQRLIFPNGWTLDIGAMPGADGQGMAGLHDQVDSHWIRTFGSAILMSGIVAGVALSQPQNNGFGNQQSSSGVLSEALGQTLGTSLSQLFQKNLNVSPTLKIRPGFRTSVMAVKDLVFDRSYQMPNY